MSRNKNGHCFIQNLISFQKRNILLHNSTKLRLTDPAIVSVKSIWFERRTEILLQPTVILDRSVTLNIKNTIASRKSRNVVTGWLL